MLDLCRLLLLKTVSGGSGGGMNWNGISGVSVDISNQTVDTDNAVFDFGSLNVTFVAKKLTSTQNDTSIEIKCNHLTFGTGAFNDLGGSSKIRTVILSCANHPNTPSEFTRNGKIARFLGKPFLATDLGGTNQYQRFASPNLVEAYFLPNQISGGGGFNSAAGFADACLVSLSNALKEGLATPQTITFSNATTKAKCSTIVGTVSEVADGEDTCHMFTQDAGGSTTLLDFITNTKGWTVA